MEYFTSSGPYLSSWEVNRSLNQPFPINDSSPLPNLYPDTYSLNFSKPIITERGVYFFRMGKNQKNFLFLNVSDQTFSSLLSLFTDDIPSSILTVPIFFRSSSDMPFHNFINSCLQQEIITTVNHRIGSKYRVVLDEFVDFFQK